MAHSQPGRRIRWWLVGAIMLASVIAAVPVATIAHHIVSQSVGRTTVATNADGTERTVYWRDYPGVAGVDPQEILQGPTPEEGYMAGQNMISEIKAALSAELRIAWAPEKEQPGTRVFHEPVQNSFGGQSLLTVVNIPVSQSTSVPQAWSDKQRAIRIIGEVSARYGYSTPVLDTFDLWSQEDRIRELGGPTPDTQVIVTRGRRARLGNGCRSHSRTCRRTRRAGLRNDCGRLTVRSGSPTQSR